jgi:tetratricopeptide (TPR) repeat protein
VLGSIGHDNAGHYRARIESIVIENGAPGERRILVDLAGVSFGDTNPPYLSLRTHLDEIVAEFGGSVGQPRTTVTTQRPLPPAVPSSIEDLKALAEQGPVQNAYLLQFLGALHPQQIQGRARHRLFERSLIALEDLPDTPEIGVLRARAWAYLNRRPLALAALKSGSREGAALRAYLDGDVEELAEAVGRITSPLPRVLATLELERTRAAYGRAADAELVDELAAQYPFWAPLIAQALTQIDGWGDRSNDIVKVALDAYWPQPKYDLASAIRAAMALLSPPTDYDISKLAYEHLNVVHATLPTALDGAAPSAADVLLLLREMLVANVVDEIQRITEVLRKPDTALARAETYEPLLAGQPDFVLKRGWAEFGTSADLDEPAKSELQALGYEHLRQGAIWSQGQTVGSEGVLTFHHQFFPGTDTLNPTDAARLFFDTDWPNLAGWGWLRYKSDEDRQHRLYRCIDYTIHGFQCLGELHASLSLGANANADAATELLAATRERFIGHPERVNFLASVERQSGNDAAASIVFDEAVAAGTLDWEPYNHRGTDIAKAGKPREALEVFLKYPGFHGAGAASAVALSNYAYEAGSVLYWAGAYDEARPLYEFAAGLNTGSEASITSASRLALLDGDLETATGYTAQRARRYGNKYALRDLMMFVAALGDRETAWAVFQSMEKEIDKPDFWVGALAIQRMEGTTLAEVADWAFQGARGTARTEMDSLAMRHVFLLHVTDRKIGDDLISTLHERDPGPRVIRQRSGIVYMGDLPIWPSHHFGDPPAQDTSSANYPEKQLDSRLTTMARALAALQRKDYETAFATFDDASRIYELQEFLPYYAWASAHVGRTERVERYLVNAQAAKERSARLASSSIGTLFDEYLSLALLHGFRGDSDTALDYLVKTNADILHTESRAMFTRYEIAEVAELLYEHTDEPRYRDFMLDLARRNAIIDPAFSWPHAFVAKYSDNANERALALARALYLDPLSRRALTADPTEIGAARRRIARGNPFLMATPDLQASAGGMPLPPLLR